LLFKNLTSADKTRRIIASHEVTNKDGVRNVIRRHFICMIKEVRAAKIEKPLPYLYVLKERNNKEQKERFFCKVKNSICAVYSGRVFMITFMHSLNITLTAMPSNSTA